MKSNRRATRREEKESKSTESVGYKRKQRIKGASKKSKHKTSFESQE